MSTVSKLTSGARVGMIGILCAVLSSALLGGAALYQAARSHQAQVMSDRLKTLERSLSVKLSSQADLANSKLNYDELDPKRYPSTRAKYLRLVPARVDDAHDSTPKSPSHLDSQESAHTGIDAVEFNLIDVERGETLSGDDQKAWFDAYWSPRDRWRDASGTLWLTAPPVKTVRARRARGEHVTRVVIRQGRLPSPTLPYRDITLATLITFLLAFGAARVIARQESVGSSQRLIPLLTPLAVTPLICIITREITRLESSSGAQMVGATLVALVTALPLLILGISQLWTRARPSPHRVAYTYVAPTMLSVSLLVLTPFALGVALAFTRYQRGEMSFVGLRHFYDILSISGEASVGAVSFYFTLGVTLLWTALNVALHLTIGLAFALLLNREGLRLRGIYRALLIIPWAIPNYITALIWRGMFNQQYGLINGLLRDLGLEPVAWMSGFWTALFANITTNTWLGFPFMMVVALGALQSIPTDLYEAARIAGASRWVQLREITIPLLKPALLPAVILGSVWTFNMFNIIYLVSGGRPAGETDILITEAYRVAFEQGRYGYAAAYSLVIFIILLGYAGLTQRLSRSAEEVYR